MICRPADDLLVHPCVPVPMRDRVHLAALIVRPTGPGRFPVLLARTPYGKNNEMPNFVLQAARNGYVVVVQDVRGTGESEGVFLPLQMEVQDAYDTLQWLTEQDYAQPQVGMFGGSYVGFTQFAAAASGHPALTALTPRVCTNNPHDLWDNGQGAFPLQTWIEWNASAVLSQAALRAPQEMSAEYFRFNRTLQEGFSSGAAYQALPLANIPFLGEERLSSAPLQALQLFEQVQNQPTLPLPDLPMLFIGGWYDPFTTRFLRSCTLSPEQTHQHLLIGPWDHTADNQVIGDLDFGYQASPWALNLPDTLLKWFDFILKGVQNNFAGKLPVHVFEMGTNQFQNFPAWPPPGTHEEMLYLHSSGQAALAKNGTLSTRSPSQEPPDRFTYNPADPVPTTGGALLRSPRVTTGPRDQAALASRPDVLVYASSPLQESQTVIGPVQLTLHVSSTAADTDFTARLVDVHPDGRSFNLLQGHFRMRYRDPHTGPVPMLPDQVYRIELHLGATCHTFQPGHRIGLHLSSSDFPYTLRNLNTMEPLLEQQTLVTADNSIHHSQAAPSFLHFATLPSRRDP